MAGTVRQPIDLEAFTKYIDEHVPEIKTPVDLKQVSYDPRTVVSPHTNGATVWLWSIKSHVPSNIC